MGRPGGAGAAAAAMDPVRSFERWKKKYTRRTKRLRLQRKERKRPEWQVERENIGRLVQRYPEVRPGREPGAVRGGRARRSMEKRLLPRVACVWIEPGGGTVSVGPWSAGLSDVPVGKRRAGWHCSAAGSRPLLSRGRDGALFFLPRQRSRGRQPQFRGFGGGDWTGCAAGAVGPAAGGVCGLKGSEEEEEAGEGCNQGRLALLTRQRGYLRVGDSTRLSP